MNVTVERSCFFIYFLTELPEGHFRKTTQVQRDCDKLKQLMKIKRHKH